MKRGWGGEALLYILVRKGLSDKIVFEKRPEIMRECSMAERAAK